MSANNVIKKIRQHINQVGQLKVGVLASGSGSNLQALIDFQTNNPCHFQIVCVVVNKKNALAQKRAQAHGINNYLVEHRLYDSRQQFEEKLISVLDIAGVDVVVLAGFMRILSPFFVDHFHRSNDREVGRQRWQWGPGGAAG